MWPWKRLATKTWFIAVLLGLALLGRLWFYAYSGPGSLNQDEAAILLNARLLAQTGKDEWGVSWPANFRSFGDAKLPGYIYTVFLLGKLIGFSELTVRLPSLFAGILLLWLVYRFAGRLTRSQPAGLVAGLLVAISPWSWHYGTLGFEAHLGLALWLAGLHLVLFESGRRSVAGAVVIGAALLTYNAPLLLLPSAVAAALLLHWGRWRSAGGKVLLLALAGLAAGSLTLAASLQKGGISIFQDPTYLQFYPDYRARFGSEIWRTLLGSKLFYFGSIAWSNWWSHLSWNFLVLRGGNNPWHTIPLTGHVHFFLPVLLAAGTAYNLVRLAKDRWGSLGRRSLTILGLFAWSLAPAAITADAPHATRSLFFFVMMAIIAAQALTYLDQRVCDSRLPRQVRDGITYTFAGLLVIGFALWWWPARRHWQQAIHPRWNRGLKEALLDPRVDAANKVYVVDPDGFLYTLVAQTKSVPGERFLSTVQRSAPDTAGLVRVEKFAKYEFIFQPSDAKAPAVLLRPLSNQVWDIIEL